MLTGKNSTTTPATGPPPPPPPPPPPNNVDSDFIVILAAFICALICVLGLVAIARCTWVRRISGETITGSANNPPTAAANKGLKKKVLKALPKMMYSSETIGTTVSDCAICLTEFVAGDEIRVLPQCGHGFHVTCIDTWFGAHSSCPSCRKVLVPVPRCNKCGEPPVSVLTGETSGSVDGFLV